MRSWSSASSSAPRPFQELTALKAQLERENVYPQEDSKSPGLLSLEGYVSADGEKCYIIEWDSEENLARSRDHPVHQKAMAEGRDKLYTSFNIQVCRELRTSIGGSLEEEHTGAVANPERT